MDDKTKNLMNLIVTCYSELSPENLWCDGEASPAQARATEKRVQAELKKLFKELGRTVGEQEAWNFCREQNRF